MAILQQGNSRASDENSTNVGLQGSEPERNQAPALGVTVSGEAKGAQRIIVSFTGYRVRPLDPDNFAGGCKDLLDGIKHAGLIHGDEPWKIKFETEQVKVSSYKEEKTVITLEYPNG